MLLIGLVELYSNPNEVVLTPFMGVGSEVYSPVSLGRKAIGIELKDSYFKQAVLNLKQADKRFKEEAKQLSLI
jgi:DNA modification methylase